MPAFTLRVSAFYGSPCVDVEVVLGPPGNGRDGNVYPVLVGGVEIGRVERYYATFETKSKGSRYVNRRWRSLRWGAVYIFGGVHKGFYGLPCDNRQSAAQLVVEEYLRNKRKRETGEK